MTSKSNSTLPDGVNRQHRQQDSLTSGNLTTGLAPAPAPASTGTGGAASGAAGGNGATTSGASRKT
jgi:hypothetical protein